MAAFCKFWRATSDTSAAAAAAAAPSASAAAVTTGRRGACTAQNRIDRRHHRPRRASNVSGAATVAGLSHHPPTHRDAMRPLRPSRSCCIDADCCCRAAKRRSRRCGRSSDSQPAASCSWCRTCPILDRRAVHVGDCTTMAPSPPLEAPVGRCHVSTLQAATPLMPKKSMC